jgi:hypothetical protein
VIVIIVDRSAGNQDHVLTVLLIATADFGLPEIVDDERQANKRLMPQRRR